MGHGFCHRICPSPSTLNENNLQYIKKKIQHGESQMKRSELNAIMQNGLKFIGKMNFKMPPFAYWGPEEWLKAGHEYDEIRENMLGWDITDFGGGDFMSLGLLMFTIRNGNISIPEYKKPYAEKLLIVEEEQVTPYHYHWSKMEDIINRGGGNLLVKLYNADQENNLDETDVVIRKDGHICEAAAGTVVRLTPGESITLVPELYHKFWGEAGKGRILLGEVSTVNDDRVDNCFLEDVGRFPEIEEDVKPYLLLANEYPPARD